MKRKITQQFITWKDSGTEKPLMVIGARQVGKTYAIEEFAKEYWPAYEQFNLMEREDIVDLFKSRMSAQDKIDQLEFIVGHPVDFENTLLFFDEAQQSEELVEALKFFAESKTRYHVICAGSLLGVKINRFKRSFPVGKVKMIHMYPMDFEEYLDAIGQQELGELIRGCLIGNKKMSDPVHQKCLNLYRRYLCVGGMPEAVMDLLNKGNEVLRFDRSILDDICKAYIADMNKYIKNKPEAAKIEAIYRSVPSQLGNKSYKFQYSKVKKGARGRDYDSALNWLAASEMVLQCKAVTLPKMPLKGYLDASVFKIFMNDPGLLGNLVDIRYPDIMLDRAFDYKGMLTESYVASQLNATGIPLLYWRNESSSEIDFLIQTDDGIIPIECKSGTNKVCASLKTYQEKFKPPWAIRLMAKNFGFTNNIKTIPLYAAFALAELSTPNRKLLQFQ
jgi:predicted AAA+ superfamily ATPase